MAYRRLVMTRLMFAIAAATLCCVAGCDFSPFSYAATGRVLDDTGAPLKEVRVCLFRGSDPTDSSYPGAFVHAGPTTLPAYVDDRFLSERSVICDQFGVYHATFSDGLDRHEWFCIHKAPEEPAVYVFVKPRLEWHWVFVELSYDSQRKTFPEGRVINVPDAVFPRPVLSRR